MKKLLWNDLSQEDKDIINKKLFWRKWLLGLFVPGLALLWARVYGRFFIVLFFSQVMGIFAGISRNEDLYVLFWFGWFVGLRVYVISNFSEFSFNYSNGFVRGFIDETKYNSHKIDRED